MTDPMRNILFHAVRVIWASSAMMFVSEGASLIWSYQCRVVLQQARLHFAFNGLQGTMIKSSLQDMSPKKDDDIKPFECEP